MFVEFVLNLGKNQEIQLFMMISLQMIGSCVQRGAEMWLMLEASREVGLEPGCRREGPVFPAR